MIALFRFHIVLFPQLDFVSVFFLLVNPKRKASRQTGKKAASNIRTRVFFTYSTQSSSCSLFFLCALVFFFETPRVLFEKSQEKYELRNISEAKKKKNPRAPIPHSTECPSANRSAVLCAYFHFNIEIEYFHISHFHLVRLQLITHIITACYMVSGLNEGGWGSNIFLVYTEIT